MKPEPCCEMWQFLEESKAIRLAYNIAPSLDVVVPGREPYNVVLKACLWCGASHTLLPVDHVHRLSTSVISKVVPGKVCITCGNWQPLVNEKGVT